MGLRPNAGCVRLRVRTKDSGADAHGQYHEAVRHVEAEQLLKNIVLLRYGEIPLNLNVNSITAQYELDASAEARPFFGTPNPAGNTFRTFPMVLPDLMLQGSNRPTFSLDPADGSDAVRQYLTPISPDFLVFLNPNQRVRQSPV